MAINTNPFSAVVYKQRNKKDNLVLMVLLLLNLICHSTSKHIKGSWNIYNLKTFVAKFAFETSNDAYVSNGYVYGNVTASEDISSSYTLVFMNESSADDFYKGKTCSMILDDIGKKAYDGSCNPDGTDDMLRGVPCTNARCNNQDHQYLVSNYQFTFNVANNTKEMYWYVAFASCFQLKSSEGSCKWHQSIPIRQIHLDYDIWLVNGLPGDNSTKLFSHQLSLDQQGLPQMFIAFTSLYLVLTGVHFVVQRIPRHPVILLLTITLLLQLTGVSFGCAHHVLYAFDGIGEPILRACGRCLDEVVQCVFVLLILLLARGWRITRVDIRQKRLLFIVWSGYSIVYLTLVLLSVIYGDPLENQTYYHMWWGLSVLILRVIMILWFFFELRATYKQESGQYKQVFYKVFGCVYCLWFLYLPVAVTIVSQINQFKRAKTLIGLELSADFVSISSMCILMLPQIREKYFSIHSHLDESSNIAKEYGISYESLSQSSKSVT